MPPADPAVARTVLFHRDYRGFTGGHLKVRHYFDYVGDAPGLRPRIYFTRRSRRDHTNPWLGSDEIVPDWSPADADVLFLAGLDWKAIPQAMREDPPVPIVNLVQSSRHADPRDPRHEFLRHRAIRICVSSTIEAALRKDDSVNGPLLHVPLGLDQAVLPTPGPVEHDLVIAAVKAPWLGRRLRARLRRPGRRILLLTRLLPRQEYLRLIAGSRVALFLPRRVEGCYMPALEAMAMGRVVVCAENTSCEVYCSPGHDSFCPTYELDALAAAAEQALDLDDDDARTMGERAAEKAGRHTIERERDAVLGILGRLDELWDQAER